MKEGLLDILKGKFLVSDEAVKNWRFIIFGSFLAIVMIASSHSADKKVHDIARLNDQVKELRSEFVDTRTTMQKLQLESYVRVKMKERGLQPSSKPPKKIRVSSQD